MRYLALRHPRWTIHMRRTILIQPVPMDTRCLVAQLIPNGDNHTFAFVNF